MLIITAELGDEIHVDTPGGRVTFIVGGPARRRRRMGIVAPPEYRISRGDGPAPNRAARGTPIQGRATHDRTRTAVRITR